MQGALGGKDVLATVGQDSVDGAEGFLWSLTDTVDFNNKKRNAARGIPVVVQQTCRACDHLKATPGVQRIASCGQGKGQQVD